MHGKLDPEERVMEKLEEINPDQDYFAWEHGGIMDKVDEVIRTLEWDYQDDIQVEIGGTVVSGIHQGETYNKKWASQYGNRKYNKDAFIVIKNKSRNPWIPSQPPEKS